MQFDAIIIPSQTIIPLGIALAHLALALFILFRRRFRNFAFPRLFILYLVLTSLWDVNLVLNSQQNLAARYFLPNFDAMQLSIYGLIVLGLFYWMFARSFLQLSWRSPGFWLFLILGIGALALSIGIDLGQIILPAEAYTWSNGWVHPANATFMLGTAGWWLFMGLTLIAAFIQLVRTQSPAHQNRIKYLVLATVMISVSYGINLTLIDPLWVVGIIIALFGNTLAGYIATVENLIDLGTGVRRVVRESLIIGMTVLVYIAGIYLVQIFLGDFLSHSFFATYMDPTLLVAVVTAILLTIVYTPITRISRALAEQILFGQHYDFQKVIQNYTQAISNILYLDDLATVATTRIKHTLNITEGVIFILEGTTNGHLYFRTLPYVATNKYLDSLTLAKKKPIYNRLVEHGKPLAQYTVDISPHFKDTPEEERTALKTFNFEWFIPILKKQQLVGIFGLGRKTSGRPYGADDINLLTTLADQTALALENAQLVDRLQQNLQEITRIKNLMDNVFDSMDNGVITTDLANKITLFNRAAESILGLPPADQSIGKEYTQIMPSLTKTLFPKLVSNVVKQEQHYTNYEFAFDLPNRGRIDLSLNLAPLKDERNQTQGVTMVMDDITETNRLRAVQQMFRRYVSPAVVDRLPSDPSKLELGGHRQEVSILFADIRGFTTFSEKLEPEKLVDTLNEYLSMAAASILMYEGTLDKFMGDAVMGIFNAPLEQEDHVLRAVRAALAMQRAIADYHHRIGELRGLSFGVGIHVGEAVVGNIGMSDRMDYTAIGDTVNLAKRIQENTPGHKILISEDVHRVVNGSVKSSFYQKMQVKGRQQPVKTYELQVP